jgi:hypothetical protein
MSQLITLWKMISEWIFAINHLVFSVLGLYYEYCNYDTLYLYSLGVYIIMIGNNV